MHFPQSSPFIRSYFSENGGSERWLAPGAEAGTGAVAGAGAGAVETGGTGASISWHR